MAQHVGFSAGIAERYVVEFDFILVVRPLFHRQRPLVLLIGRIGKIKIRFQRIGIGDQDGYFPNQQYRAAAELGKPAYILWTMLPTPKAPNSALSAT